jgi:hypothetical protein
MRRRPSERVPARRGPHRLTARSPGLRLQVAKSRLRQRAPKAPGIPQNNGGDQDADSNGDPSDGDSNI